MERPLTASGRWSRPWISANENIWRYVSSSMLMAIQMPIQFQDESVSIFLPPPLRTRALARRISPVPPYNFPILPPYTAEPFLYYSCPLYISTLAISSAGTTKSETHILYANKCIFSLIKRGRSLRNCRTCNEVFQLRRVIDSTSISDIAPTLWNVGEDVVMGKLKQCRDSKLLDK